MALKSGTPIGVGSLPHLDLLRALDVIMASMPDSPHWPQLPNRSFLEGMEHQFSACLPGLVVDHHGRRMYIDDRAGTFGRDLERFWEMALVAGQGGTLDFFGVHPDWAPGLGAFLARAGRDPGFAVVKGQVTGPFTLGLGLCTADGRPAMYDETMGEVITHAVACQARWQARVLSGLSDTVIVAVDEPVLSTFGSTAMITVSRDHVTRTLGEVVAAVHAEGALVWTHCCGNTDWSMIVDAGVDIVNFDAYRFAEKMAVYSSSVSDLLARGGWMGWGVVPTSTDVRSESPGSLLGRLRQGQETLSSRGVDPDLLAARTLISPACGTGPMEPGDAEAVYALTADVAAAWQVP